MRPLDDAVPRRETMSRVRLGAGSLVISGLLYIPQFFGTQPLRVTHGLLILAGCVWIAVELWRVTGGR